MRLSQLLADNPELDVELDDLSDGDVVVDGVYLLRVARLDRPAETTLYYHSSPHTDTIVQSGIVHSAANMFRSGARE